jgi:hypothetical protein
MKTQRGRGVCALEIVTAVAALAAVSCLGPTGIEVRGLDQVIIQVQEGLIQESLIWKGEAAGHAGAYAKWGAPQQGWMYRNITDTNIYRYDGEVWTLAAGGPPVPSTIQIEGDYVPDDGDYFPVRVHFTDGGVADGYVDDATGGVMLYDDEWNDQGGTGKTYHTLKLLTTNENILLSRAFDTIDPVVLNLGADGKLRFRAAIAHPTDITDQNLYHPIDTAGELALIGRDTGTLAGAYLLMRNLDLLGSPAAESGSLTPNSHNWKPIGTYSAQFTGTFDGGDRDIKNLYINRPGENYVGLFGYINGAKLKGIVLKQGSVTGKNNVGGIAGYVAGTSEISGCSNTGAVTGGYYTGGITGRNFGTGSIIIKCHNTGAVTGGESTGGVAGDVVTCTITACYNTGVVKGTNSNTGGIAGKTNGGSSIITACYNTGAVTGGNYTGGVAGLHWGVINSCYNTGAVTGASSVGGIAGRWEGASIIACYNTGAVKGNMVYGGVSGELIGGGTPNGCYWLSIPGVEFAVKGNGTGSNNTNATPFSSTNWPSFSGDWVAYQWSDDGDEANDKYWKSEGAWIAGNNGLDSVFPKLYWEP